MPALTKRFIDSLKPTSKEQIYYDPALIGFGIRVRPNGRKAYLVRYRNAEGLHKKLILGYHGELTPATARALAQRNLAEIHDGADPVTAKKERREAPTVADLGQRYLDFHAVKLKPASQEAALEPPKKTPASRKLPVPAVHRLALRSRASPCLRTPPIPMRPLCGPRPWKPCQRPATASL